MPKTFKQGHQGVRCITNLFVFQDLQSHGQLTPVVNLPAIIPTYMYASGNVMNKPNSCYRLHTSLYPKY